MGETGCPDCAKALNRWGLCKAHMTRICRKCEKTFRRTAAVKESNRDLCGDCAGDLAKLKGGRL